MTSGGLAALLLPRLALADPHAVFYTTRGQEQVFYNVLAALNQADYVEEPGRPPITTVKEEGDVIAGIRPPPDAEGKASGAKASPEPSERVSLPRIRVRTVTADDGDVYFRELKFRKALAETVRVQLAMISCDVQRIIYGDAVWQLCREEQGK